MAKKSKKAKAKAGKSEKKEKKSRLASLKERGHQQNIALAVLSGVLWFTSCADFDIWPFAYIAMLPAFWAVDRSKTRGRALFCGWIAGFVANAGGFYWITGLLERFGHMPLPVAILGLGLLAAYQAVVFWFFFMALRYLQAQTKAWRGQALPLVLLAPIIMVSLEYLVPFLFPWYLAITQAWVVPVIQIADITGPLGVSAFLMLVNGALYDALTRPRRDRVISLGVAAGATVLVLGYGYFRIAQTEEIREKAPALRIGVVQGNIPFDEKGINRKELAQTQLRDLQAKSAELEAQGAEFLMWTESSYPYAVPRNAGVDFSLRDSRRIRRGFQAPLMLGAMTFEAENPKRRYNSALLLLPDDTIAARFDKIFLLMFGEYTPFTETFPALKDMLPENASHFERGEEITTFPLEHEGTTYRLGPMICYEDILPTFGRKLAQEHPHVLVNITNDSWFGDTSEPWEHMALSVYRAVEMRTDLVRAVNTGVSAFIDSTGRVYSKTYAVDPKIDPRPVDGLLAEVKLVEGGHTFFSRFGDVFAYLCILACLAIAALAYRANKKSTAA